MDYLEFLKLAKQSGPSVTEKTLRLWHHIYSWVLEHGYADTADTPEFVSYVQSYREITVQTINNNLRKMETAKLLSGHSMRRNLSEDTKELLFNPIFQMFFGADGVPSSFVRYCKYGANCSLEFKSAKRMREKVNQRMADFRNDQAAP